MEPQDVEYVKKIVKAELGPVLEQKAQEIEARMIASVTAFQQQVQTNVEHHHAENRQRMQFISDQGEKAIERATEAASSSLKAVAGNDFILRRMDNQDQTSNTTQKLVLDLLGEVRSITGKSAGLAEAEAKQLNKDKDAEAKQDKRLGMVKWIAGTLATGGVGKWIWTHFHWGGK